MYERMYTQYILRYIVVMHLFHCRTTYHFQMLAVKLLKMAINVTEKSSHQKGQRGTEKAIPNGQICKKKKNERIEHNYIW